MIRKPAAESYASSAGERRRPDPSLELKNLIVLLYASTRSCIALAAAPSLMPALDLGFSVPAMLMLTPSTSTALVDEVPLYVSPSFLVIVKIASRSQSQPYQGRGFQRPSGNGKLVVAARRTLKLKRRTAIFRDDACGNTGSRRVDRIGEFCSAS